MSLHEASFKRHTIFPSVNSDCNDRRTTQTVSEFRNRTAEAKQSSNTQCCICNSPLGILIQCTGSCHRHFHLHDEQNPSCNPFLVDPNLARALWRNRRSFVCPLCWTRSRDGCRGCGKVSTSTLKKCDVTSCLYHFCQDCISTFKSEVAFNGVFICPDHYCYKCRSIIPINADQSGLLHCPICSRSCHSICLDDPNEALFSQGVMICPQHCLSPQQYWNQLISDWKGQLLVDHLSSNPNKRLCEEATDLSSVLRPKTGLEEMIKAVFEEEKSQLDPAASKMKVYPPYDTIPTIPSDEEINTFQELLKFPTQTTWNELTRCTSTFKRYLENLRVYLNPLLQRNRYTSYGRHFSNLDVLQTVAELTVALMAEGDQLVDMTCGRNEFIPLVKNLLPDAQITGRAYDIITPLNEEDWIRKSWFDVDASELQSGDHLVIGLNPPFGKNGALAETFLKKATDFSPRFVVFIAPRGARAPPGYELIYDNPILCKEYAFFTPTGGQSWSSDPPTVRIYHRVDPPCEAILKFTNPAMLASLFPAMCELYPTLLQDSTHPAPMMQSQNSRLHSRAPHQIEIE